MTRAVWLLPTRERFEKLRDFFRAARDTQMTDRVVLIVHDEEYAKFHEEYDALIDEQVSVFKTQKDGGMAYKLQAAWAAGVCDGYDAVGILANDIIPRTLFWDKELASRLNGYNLVSPDDLWQAPRRLGGGGILFSKALLDAVGYISPPGMEHLFLDDVWETLGNDCGVWNPQLDIVIEHKHAALEAKPIDSTTRRLGGFWADDEKAYRIWRRTEREAASARIIELMKANGIKFIDADLTGIRLLIATPSPDPFFDGGFMDSLFNTKLLIEKLGGFCDFHKLPGCSDIINGRAVLFTPFVNSDFTHTLQIDADMRWAPMDVVRMLKLNEPFIAVAGPRKGDGELVFAATNADDQGHTHPAIVYQTEQGLIAEVTEVGGAFVMMDRQFAERMTTAYESLKYQSADGRVHWGLWLPMIENLRYRGEDYSLCKRWRDIGGKVKVLTTVRLGHTGTKTWEGAFIEQIQRTHAEQAQKEAAQ